MILSSEMRYVVLSKYRLGPNVEKHGFVQESFQKTEEEASEQTALSHTLRVDNAHRWRSFGFPRITCQRVDVEGLFLRVNRRAFKSFFSELHSVECAVQSVHLHEFFVCSLFHGSAIVDDDDLVAETNR